MARIELRGGPANQCHRGHKVTGYALVSDDIAEVVNRYAWHRDQRGYALTEVEGVTTRLHVFVYKTLYGFGCGSGEEIDHIDRDKLNCLDSNLRRVTRSFNRANKIRQRNNTSGYCGVEWRPEMNVWRATVQVQGKRFRVGNFVDPKDAARAVNAAYCKFFPGVAVPNPEVE